MTDDLTSLLERLKVSDPATYQIIDFRLSISNGYEDYLTELTENGLDILQGCLQRACEKQGWSLSQHQGNGKCGAIIRYHANFKPVEGYGDSPASALLPAYLKAIEEKKS